MLSAQWANEHNWRYKLLPDGATSGTDEENDTKAGFVVFFKNTTYNQLTLKALVLVVVLLIEDIDAHLAAAKAANA